MVTQFERTSPNWLYFNFNFPEMLRGKLAHIILAIAVGSRLSNTKCGTPFYTTQEKVVVLDAPWFHLISLKIRSINSFLILLTLFKFSIS
ncbi:Uncharacterised protein [Legionella cincinnatiensis]|uniref:Uncharacterized protein n=1 Tax=Legionella cincinnatiensis TaxID=28085 RepID=A0A378IL45_9GAMM|nr:hypothetical protein Lcin_2528 [Legionella cincinnatiensis]STX35713.1 Uncharacterised protein [Legionella cincinnatiensis]